MTAERFSEPILILLLNNFIRILNFRVSGWPLYQATAGYFICIKPSTRRWFLGMRSMHRKLHA